MSGINRLRSLAALSVLLLFVGTLHAANTLTLSTHSVLLTCAKGVAACNATATVGVTDGAGTDFFGIAAATVPYWLQVTPMNGAASVSSQNLTFQPSTATVNLPVGVNTASVQITGTNLTTATITVTLQITDSAPGLSVQPANPTVNWQIGQPYPQISLTLYSTSTVPVPFTAAVTSNPTQLGVANWLSPYNVQGIAYGWGTTIPLVVSQNAYQQAQAGETLQGSVDIDYGASSSTTVSVSIVVGAPPVVITSLSPPAVPMVSTTTSGALTIAINGSNFVQNNIQTTKVFTGTGANLTVCSACTVHVLNSQNMTVAIPYDNTGVPFRTAGTLTIGLANGATNTPQSTKNLSITSAPIISSITSASTLMAPPPGSNPTIAPYDVISIFGSNFCPQSITGCSTPVVASVDSYYRYPSYLSPDNGTHKLAVMFSKISNVPPAWANVPGYLLFAGNTQINSVVPAGIAAQLGTGTVKVVVSFDTSATNPAASASSVAAIVNVAAADPGAFILDATGQGAILDATTYLLNTQSTPAIGGSSTVAIYMTGLGIPNSNASNVQQVGSPPTSCIAPIGAVGNATTAPSGYLGTINTLPSGGGYVPPAGYTPPNPLWTSIDGAVIRSTMLMSNVSPPCFGAAPNTLPIVTIGGQPATVGYAGFVADSVAGLYQVNVLVPNVGNGTSAAQFPVVVTMGGVVAPTVQIWVQ